MERREKLRPSMTPGTKRKEKEEEPAKRTRKLRFDVLEAWGEGVKDDEATQVVEKSPTAENPENLDLVEEDVKKTRMTMEDAGCPLGEAPILSIMESGANLRMVGHPLSCLQGQTGLETILEENTRAEKRAKTTGGCQEPQRNHQGYLADKTTSSEGQEAPGTMKEAILPTSSSEPPGTEDAQHP